MHDFKDIQQKEAPLVYRMCEKIYNTVKLQVFIGSMAVGAVGGGIGGYVATQNTLSNIQKSQSLVDENSADFSETAAIATSPKIAPYMKTAGALIGTMGGSVFLAFGVNTLLMAGARGRKNYDQKQYLKARNKLGLTH